MFIESELQKYNLKSFESEFSEYLESNSVTKSELDAIHREYNNYGICSQFRINALEAGEFRARILIKGFELQEHVD